MTSGSKVCYGSGIPRGFREAGPGWRRHTGAAAAGGQGGGSGKVRGQQRGRQGVPLEMHLEGSDDE